ncbi:MAG TPA: MarR family transcriptional regulator [Beijerinckiaceae bacterium]|jgi:DNA-binding MarR family transcriptional regulator
MTERPENLGEPGQAGSYALDEQVGFLLRQVSQRHAVIFAGGIGCDLTPTQWAALAKLHEVGACSQNHLGRLTAMDAATVKGVVDRLAKRDLARTRSDPQDGRRLLVEITPAGRDLVERTIPRALAVTEETLAPLKPAERRTLLGLLRQLR